MAGARILVVEDNLLMAEVICDFLRSCGLQPVGPVGSVESGVHLVRHEEIDAAVLDINLQGRMCFPICSELLKRHVPFMFLSGYAGSALVPSEFQAMRHIEKPFAPEEFQSVLQDLVGRRVNGHNGNQQQEGFAP
jgi:CheY-like chemotaxis protein